MHIAYTSLMHIMQFCRHLGNILLNILITGFQTSCEASGREVKDGLFIS